jgi:hypothetical protein
MGDFMRLTLTIASLLATALMAGAASAAPASDNAPTAVSTPATAAAPVADGDKVTCKTIAVTGTRFGTQVCHSKREWADMAQSAHDYVQHATTGACQGTTCH